MPHIIVSDGEECGHRTVRDISDYYRRDPARYPLAIEVSNEEWRSYRQVSQARQEYISTWIDRRYQQELAAQQVARNAVEDETL